MLSRYVNEPKNYHLAAAWRAVQYLIDKTDYRLVFKYSPMVKNDVYPIAVYADASYAGDKADRKSHSGWVSTINDCPIAWQSKKQSTTALSSCEAELYSLCEGVKEALFLKQWFEHYKGKSPYIELREDNKGTLEVADHSTNHNNMKHVDVKHFFVREHVSKGHIVLKYIDTNNQLADILTKATKKIIFTRLVNKLMKVPVKVA
jgi:hypothetical protein